MDEKRKYANEWEVSSKHFYDKKYYEWMHTRISQYDVVLEIGCGTGYSTLELLKHGHKVIVIEKNDECINDAKIRIQEQGFLVGDIEEADVTFVSGDIADDSLQEHILKDFNFDIVLCWNVGTYFDESTRDYYLPYLLKYGLNNQQIDENFESSYAELILWYSAKIASSKKVPIHIVERTMYGITPIENEYYCALGSEFGFKQIVVDNLPIEAISNGGRILKTKTNVCYDKIIKMVLVAIFITY